MLDPNLLVTLAAVVREGSFERAARKLHITSSAVSQRIRALALRNLEQATGAVLRASLRPRPPEPMMPI